MKLKTAFRLMTSTIAMLSIAACNHSGNQGQGSGTTNDTIAVGQAKPPPGGAWTDVVNATSDGGVVMGNPDAKVKLLEIASLGCPYCKRFEDEGAPHVIDYVKTGQLSWEFRPYIIHGPVDMAANLIVRCNGLKTFFPLVFALYRDQTSWMDKVEAAPKDKTDQMQNLPTTQVFAAFADLAGLPQWAAARGVPMAKSSQCLSDQKMIDREVQITSNVSNEFPDFKGTPSFVLNGKFLTDVGTWDKLKPQLDAAVQAAR